MTGAAPDTDRVSRADAGTARAGVLRRRLAGPADDVGGLNHRRRLHACSRICTSVNWAGWTHYHLRLPQVKCCPSAAGSATATGAGACSWKSVITFTAHPFGGMTDDIVTLVLLRAADRRWRGFSRHRPRASWSIIFGKARDRAVGLFHHL